MIGDELNDSRYHIVDKLGYGGYSTSQHPGQNLIPTVRDEFEVHGLRLCYLDLHLANVLLKFSTNIDVLSIDQLYDMYGKPETLPIIRSNGEPLPDTMPAHAVQSFFLGKSMDDLALPFEPTLPNSYSSDIWSPATALWDIIGMKTMFSSEWATEDEVASQQVDVLGSMPADWYASWEGRSQFWDEEWCPLGGELFEDCVQKWRRNKGWEEVAEDEKTAFLKLICKMMKFRPEERLTADEVLKEE
ncbi:hypothetical protein BJX68DRAFT_252995 [Aspergillus pseudodeflectus]|uniref:Protein kinase domain-containing protein n=1 Tax=Aspergillus pseudodeflectus TaxID=176178 RepID=A0ABR4KYZ6_9EURO